MVYGLTFLLLFAIDLSFGWRMRFFFVGRDNPDANNAFKSRYGIFRFPRSLFLALAALTGPSALYTENEWPNILRVAGLILLFVYNIFLYIDITSALKAARR